MGWLRNFERLLLILGLVLLGIYVAARIDSEVLSRAAIGSFKGEHAIEQTESWEPVAAKPDFSLWSQKRIDEYEASLSKHFAPAVGILRIPKIGLEAPILEGTDDLTLNRGVGRVEGTAQLGENGNVGIAGHRDGFFRGLKQIVPGDEIEIVSASQNETYVVDNIVIVKPDDVSVLQPRVKPGITLVTCYPFYYVGSAPQRYVVEASIVGAPEKRQEMQRTPI